MNKSRIALCLLVAIGGVIFVVRHRALRDLNAQQDQLRLQNEEVSHLEDSIAQLKNSARPANEAGLSPDERSELLRLRGQVGPMRLELTQATNQLTKLSRAPRPKPSSATPEDTSPSRDEAVARMNRSRQWMISLLIYATDHGDQLPQKLEDAVNANHAIGSLDEFEFLQSGAPLASLRSPSSTIVLREKTPWQRNGRWHRTYAFADGHSETAASETGDFTEWEARHQPAENQTGP